MVKLSIFQLNYCAELKMLLLLLCSYRRRCYLKRVIILPAPPKVTKLDNVVSGFPLKNCV